MAKKFKSKTRRTYRRLKALKVGLHIGTYVLPIVPSIIVAWINWDKWFSKSNWSVGLGLGTLLVTVVVTILSIIKKDKAVSENMSKMYHLAIVMTLWAVALMFLASIAAQFGKILLFTSFGIIGGATCDQFNKFKLKEELTWRKEMMKEVGLDKKEESRKRIKERALLEAHEEAKRRAVE